MSRPDDDFDVRMRRHFAGVDTSPGFEARLAARIAAIDAVPADTQRARVERQREALHDRLRREAWTNVAVAAGVGAAALVVVWRHGPAVAESVAGSLAVLAQPSLLGGVAVAVLVASLWPVVEKYLPR